MAPAKVRHVLEFIGEATRSARQVRAGQIARDREAVLSSGCRGRWRVPWRVACAALERVGATV